jgi:molybdate transport system substrate-binding protein
MKGDIRCCFAGGGRYDRIRRQIIQFISLMMVIGLVTGCSDRSSVATTHKETELQVFIAASLNNAMTEVAKLYLEKYPEVKIILNADSSGKLLTQIEEGYQCDIFISAAQKQVNQLENTGLMVEGKRENVVNNQLIVITRNNSQTKVTGLENIEKASSLALADGSVPAGRYTREALVKLGLLEEVEDVSKLTTAKVSEALGGLEISEQGNVSKVLISVIEGSCEVGTVYYSDTYGYEDQLDIIEKISYDLTGDILYPVCLVKNAEATEERRKAAEDFYQYILSEEAKAVFDKYYFDTDIR